MNKNLDVQKIPYECKKLEEKANQFIADYGFKHNEEEISKEEETHRTQIRRQRDKILYTGGFRRMQDKTQVMSATLTGDHRTRLTHTLEVDQIATSVADALGLNRDLVSAIAFGHDVGHTPFGHAAENTLNDLLKNNGGFHHPIQSVKYLWEKFGNKLINEIYEGILAHDSDMFIVDKENAKNQLKYSEYCSSKDENCLKECFYFESFLKEVPSTLEAQAVVWADKIAYITHDLEDFLQSPIYTSLIKAEKNDKNPSSESTEKKLLEILRALLKSEKKSPDESEMKSEIKSIDEFELRDLVRKITSNLIEASAQNIMSIDGLEQSVVKVKTIERLKKQDENLKPKKKYLNSLIINLEDNFRENYYRLRELLDNKYILSPHVQRSDAKAHKIVSSLYLEFTNNPKLLPLVFQTKIDKEFESIILEVFGEEDVDLKELEKKWEAIKDREDSKDNKIKLFEKYKEKKENMIGRIVASYISTMSDTYAENMFCNLNASKDNYSL